MKSKVLLTRWRRARLNREYSLACKAGFDPMMEFYYDNKVTRAQDRYFARVAKIHSLTSPDELEIFLTQHSPQAITALAHNPHLTVEQVLRLITLVEEQYRFLPGSPGRGLPSYIPIIIKHQPNITWSTLDNLAKSARDTDTLKAIAKHANTSTNTKIIIALELGGDRV